MYESIRAYVQFIYIFSTLAHMSLLLLIKILVIFIANISDVQGFSWLRTGHLGCETQFELRQSLLPYLTDVCIFLFFFCHFIRKIYSWICSLTLRKKGKSKYSVLPFIFQEIPDMTSLDSPYHFDHSICFSLNVGGAGIACFFVTAVKGT